MDDKSIREMVVDELEFDPAVTAGGIGVAVKDGIVTLTGHVPAYAQKWAAAKAAQRVKGVRGVAQDLTVRLPGDVRQSDDEIATHAANVLKWSVGATDNVKVMVDGGWVTLSGDVPWNYQREACERAVRNLAGVVDVFNSIVVKQAVQPNAVAASIRKAFERNADLESAGIKVDVAGAKVTLSGKVRAWYERKMAEDAAWAIPGVTSVQDNLTI